MTVAHRYLELDNICPAFGGAQEVFVTGIPWISEEEVRALYGTVADVSHDFDHILRVLVLAERIARAEGADLSIVRAAALLHDWGRAEAEARGVDHAQYAAERARAWLLSRDADPAWVEAVCYAIASHRYLTGPAPASIEAQVLFDADKLDAMGAIGIARAYAFSGLHHQRLYAPVRGTLHERSHEHTPYHEFVFKLSRLRDRLFTPTARAIAQERHAFMEAFFARLEAELRGEA